MTTMKNNDILIAFSNDKIITSITKLLKSEGLQISYACNTGFELITQLQYFSSGIIICGSKFRDISITNLVYDIPEYFSVIVIGTYSQLESIENERLFKLSVPLNREDLICSINMLNLETNLQCNIKKRNDEDNILINNAKKLLIDRYNMSEEQAYRYIQKKSMNTGKRMENIAKDILY